MHITLTSIFVDDQAKAREFYTSTLGFQIKDDIPFNSFSVTDVYDTHRRLVEKGVHFVQPPTDYGAVIVAVFDDTCGNLLQVAQMK